METARALLGIHIPGKTRWHRMGVGQKYLVFLSLTLPAVASPSPWLSTGLLAASALAVLSTRAPLRIAVGMPVSLAVLLAILGAYHVVMGQPGLAVTVVCTLMVALYASRVLLLTTPYPALIDAVVTFVRPLRRLGLDPERFGLAVAIMVRSIPFIAGSFADVRRAAQARGLERNPLALIAPVVIQTVAYARSTGEALAARGLGEDGE